MWYTTSVWRVAYQKQRLGRKLVGGGAGLGVHLKNGIPYLFLQSLKVATSNLVHNVFGEYVTITALVRNLVGAGWSTVAPQ